MFAKQENKNLSFFRKHEVEVSHENIWRSKHVKKKINRIALVLFGK